MRLLSRTTLLAAGALVIAAAVTFVACSAGYSSNDADASVDSGASSTQDSSVGTAGDGSAAADSAFVDSGGSGSSDAAADAVAPFCADAGFLCDDFDQPANTWPIPPWNDTHVDEGGVLALQSSAVHSPPNAVELVMPVHSTPKNIRLQEDYVGVLKGMRCELQAQVASRGSVELTFFDMRITSSSGGLYYRLIVQLFNNATNVTINGVVSQGAALPVGSWTHVVIDAAFDTKTTLTFNDAPQVSVVGSPSDGSSPSAAAVVVEGDQGSADTLGWKIYIDDVRCDLR